MKSSTRSDSSNQDPFDAKVKTTTRCRLCRETIVLENAFRVTTALCPSCGLTFAFDPQREPLPVPGMRLRYAAVLEAQRGGQTRYTRHAAHVPRVAATPVPPPTSYFAWGVRLMLAMAAGAVLFGGFAQRLLHR